MPGCVQRGKAGDKGALRADSRHDAIDRDAAALGEMAIFDVELDQRLDVLGDESNRHDDQGNPLKTDVLAKTTIGAGQTVPFSSSFTLPKVGNYTVKLTVDGEKYTFHVRDMVIEGTHKLEPTKKPKQIDAVRSKGPDAGKTLKGIYELDDKTFKVCFGAAGKDQPTEFATKEGDGHRLLTFERQNP